MDENLWESVPEAFEADLTLQESFDLAIAKMYRYKAACLEAGVAIRKALPIGARVQWGEGDDTWQGTIISAQGAIADDLAGPAIVLPDPDANIEPDSTTGEVQVDVKQLTAILNGKWHWMNQMMRQAHVASHLCDAALIELEVTVRRLLLIGRTVEANPDENPCGARCHGEITGISPFSTGVFVRFEGIEYGADSSGHLLDLDQVRLV